MTETASTGPTATLSVDLLRRVALHFVPADPRHLRNGPKKDAARDFLAALAPYDRAAVQDSIAQRIAAAIAGVDPADHPAIIASVLRQAEEG